MTSRILALLAMNRSRIDESIRLATGALFLGARPRDFWVVGSMYFRMNQRPNQPGVTSSTEPVSGQRNDSEIGATYTSLDKQRCSRHCPTLHASGRGFQLS
jgi:hypothetical protein